MLRRVATRGLPQQAVWNWNWVAEAASLVCTPGVDSLFRGWAATLRRLEPAALATPPLLPAHFFGGNALLLSVCH